MPDFTYHYEIEIRATSIDHADNILREVLGTSTRAGSNLRVCGRADLHDAGLIALLEQEEAIEREVQEEAQREVARRAAERDQGVNTYPWAVCDGDRVVDRHITRQGAFGAAAGLGYSVMRLYQPYPGPGESLAQYGILLQPEVEAEAPRSTDLLTRLGCQCAECRQIRRDQERTVNSRPTPRRPYGVRTAKVRPLP